MLMRSAKVRRGFPGIQERRGCAPGIKRRWVKRSWLLLWFGLCREWGNGGKLAMKKEAEGWLPPLRFWRQAWLVARGTVRFAVKFCADDPRPLGFVSMWNQGDGELGLSANEGKVTGWV
jgi:hypothetical protein